MALPKSAAAALGADMAQKGMGAGPMPDAPESGPAEGEDGVFEDIAKDIISNKDNPKELASFLKEFIERVVSGSGPGEGEEDEEEPEAA